MISAERGKRFHLFGYPSESETKQKFSSANTKLNFMGRKYKEKLIRYLGKLS